MRSPGMTPGGPRSVTAASHDTGAVGVRSQAVRANPEVLILEDDAETLDELQSHFTRKRFHPLGARSASRALSLLEHNRYSSRPVLAIIDWDLGKAPDRSASSGDVLSRLARELRECPVIVYSQNIDAFNVRSQIQRSHPRALLHDKRDGDASLLERIDRMLDRTVGDLRIHDGTVVVHLPTLDQHHHREAIRLVVHHPDIVTFHSDTATKAVRRFGEWLHSHDSAVRLVSHGNRKYRLSVTRDRGGRSRHRGVNLSLAEIAELPLAAALVDAAGAVIARTPEWDGPGPGAVSYPVRSVRLVVRTQPASAQCDELLSRLLDVDRRRGARAQRHPGTAGPHARRIAATGRRARTRRMGHHRRRHRPGPRGDHGPHRPHASRRVAGPARPVLGPEVAALVLVQLAVNAERHDGATRGPSRGRPHDLPGRLASRRAGAADRDRAAARRARSVGPRLRADRGRRHRRHGVPAPGHRRRVPSPQPSSSASAAWRCRSPRSATVGSAGPRGRGMRRPGWRRGARPEPGSKLATIEAAAGSAPGRIVADAGFSARAGLRALWVAVPPDDSAVRAREVVTGLVHERALSDHIDEPARSTHRRSGPAAGDVAR